jgi:hypothetical protein
MSIRSATALAASGWNGTVNEYNILKGEEREGHSTGTKIIKKKRERKKSNQQPQTERGFGQGVGRPRRFFVVLYLGSFHSRVLPYNTKHGTGL